MGRRRLVAHGAERGERQRCLSGTRRCAMEDASSAGGAALDSGEVVALVGHLAWPVVVLLGLWMVRREIRSIAGRLAERIGSEATDVTLGREGIQIRQRVTPADQDRDRLLEALRTDPDFERELAEWIEEKGLSISVTSFLYGAVYESVRRAAASELLRPTDAQSRGG
jgi:hypothetical protein